MRQGNEPSWAPLVALAGEDRADAFMWMFEVQLESGEALHAYKHRDTRRYLHLTEDGRAFVFGEDGRYTEADALGELLAATAPWLDDTLRTPPPPPAELAGAVAHELVRAFAAVDHWRRELRREDPDRSPDDLAMGLVDVVSARLHDFAYLFADDLHNVVLCLLPEAIDNLGCGLTLAPGEVPAFAAEGSA